MAKGYAVKLRNGKLATVTVVPWLRGTEFPVMGSVKGKDELWKVNGRYLETERSHPMDIVEGLPGLKPKRESITDGTNGADEWGKSLGL